MSTRARVGALSLALVLYMPRDSNAQIARDSSVDWLVSAGSEAENYLRVLQVAGLAPMTQWSVRPLAAAELAGLAAGATSLHPWASRLAPRSTGQRVWVRALVPEIGEIYNSTFPYGINDGPVWAGRGLTTYTIVGVQGALGPVRLVLAPEAFRAENAAYSIAPNGLGGRQRFADARETSGIDLPQRFGDKPYQRVDLGQSFVYAALPHITMGASTANEIWGPAAESPFLLGTNAAGFQHLFFGLDTRGWLGSARLNARLIVGRLEQSDYSPASDADRRRSISGTLLVLRVRQLPGLEVGVARIFEQVWPDSGGSLTDVISKALRSTVILQPSKAFGGGDAANQIASMFGRWVFPRSSIEVYGEIGREDNAYDERDLLLEPDHDLTYMVGFQKVWKGTEGSLFSVRGELLNSEISHLQNVRLQAPPYVHDVVRQGHTQLGQAIGAAGGFGGGAASLALEWLGRSGRTTITWRRLRTEPSRALARPPDVIHAVTFERLVFGRRIDLLPEATIAYNLNRDPGGDLVDMRLGLSARGHW